MARCEKEDNHAVYVSIDNSAKKRGVEFDTITDNECFVRINKTKSGELTGKKWGVNNEPGQRLRHGNQVKDVNENEDRTTYRE